MSNKKILVVDDSATDATLVSSVLKKNGYDVVNASSGEEGVEKAKETLPDCILMDVVMPGMNGFQATRSISQESSTANIPVIILSSKNQQTDKIWAQRQGAVDYMVKPVDEKALMDKLSELLG